MQTGNEVRVISGHFDRTFIMDDDYSPLGCTISIKRERENEGKLFFQDVERLSAESFEDYSSKRLPDRPGPDKEHEESDDSSGEDSRLPRFFFTFSLDFFFTIGSSETGGVFYSIKMIFMNEQIE